MLGKKSNKLEAGLVWMPYVVSESISTLSSSFNSLSMKSRYATKMVNNSYYGFVRTTNLIRKRKIENIFKIENPTD